MPPPLPATLPEMVELRIVKPPAPTAGPNNMPPPPSAFPYASTGTMLPETVLLRSVRLPASGR